ncbi:hypothetical protein VTO42DRAFT_2912 [Malbranchea cinnamomea]
MGDYYTNVNNLLAALGTGIRILPAGGGGGMPPMQGAPGVMGGPPVGQGGAAGGDARPPPGPGPWGYGRNLPEYENDGNQPYRFRPR